MLLNDMNNSIYEIFNKPLFLTKKVKFHSKSSVVSYIFCIHVTRMYKDEYKKRLYMSCNVNWISEQILLLISWIFFVINCILLPLTYTLARSHGFNFVTSLLVWRNNILFSSYYLHFYSTKLFKNLRSAYEVKEKILL